MSRQNVEVVRRGFLDPRPLVDSAYIAPDAQFDVKRVIAEGDSVAVHSHVRHRPSEPGIAVVHIFRFEGDRIARVRSGVTSRRKIRRSQCNTTRATASTPHRGCGRMGGD